MSGNEQKQAEEYGEDAVKLREAKKKKRSMVLEEVKESTIKDSTVQKRPKKRRKKGDAFDDLFDSLF